MSQVAIVNLGPELFALLFRGLLGLLALGLLAGVAAVLVGRAPHRVALAAEHIESRPHRLLRISLGVLWIVDGLLQAQPRMPAGFVAQILQPGIADGPEWLAQLVQPLARLWTSHPVAADAATVSVQVGLGVLILLGRHRSRFALSVLWISVGWSSFVWIAGEFLGGLLHPGASWLMGSPGAVVAYAVMALLLITDRNASAAQLARRCRLAAGGWLLFAAGLQALPWEGNWTSDGLAEPFRQAARPGQPAILLRPIVHALSAATNYPQVLNLTLILALLIAGVGLLLGGRQPFLLLGLVICGLTWWLAQDFGVIGGYGTDPNTALVLAAVLAAGWPQPTLAVSAAAATAPVASRSTGRLSRAGRAGATAAGLGSLVLAPLMLVVPLAGTADANAVLADSGGGVQVLAGWQAAEFSLPDQRNQRVSMASTAGRLRLVTFLDPECSDDCPIIANQIAAAVRGLGTAANRVEIIAIDSNPLFYRVADTAAFTSSHGLADLPNWHFVAGSQSELQRLLTAYGVQVQVPSVGMIAHSEGIYFVDGTGRQVAYLDDGANPNLQSGYVRTIQAEIRKLLG